MPSLRVCERARLSSDRRFDGLFFIGVASTRIYCRAICPAPTAKRVRYFPTAAAAESQGFRPCLRCRPELAPGNWLWHRGDLAVARALQLIEQGDTDEHSIEVLAQRLCISERQLRRQFVSHVGATPVSVRNTRRLLFAKHLLADSSLSMAHVAFASGFGSLRRFNSAFREAYRMAPRQVRGGGRRIMASATTVTLALDVRQPYDAEAMLDFLRTRAIAGMEHVGTDTYARVIAFDTTPQRSFGFLRFHLPRPGAERARLELGNVPPGKLLDVVRRVRRMFDLDADPNAIRRALSRDAHLASLCRRQPGLRIPSGWDGFEIAVRAVLGQQVTIAAARTLAARIVERYGDPVHAALPDGLGVAFPAPPRLAQARFQGMGILPARAATLRRIARALQLGRVGFSPAQRLDEFVQSWCAIQGIGIWTANYLALRALGHPDAFPSNDIVLLKALSGTSRRATPQELEARAAHWRPWRAYAALHIWRDA
jgi:AraC family transcriptional regulator of adaptative response / DNA-3-methyladenine glycosylase II